MKTIALVTNIIALSTTGLFAQSQADFETLTARVNLTEAKIKNLESQLAEIKAAKQITSAPVSTKESLQSTASQTAKTSSYIVVKGDSLSRIAKLHNTSVSSLMKANALKSDRLSIGQKLSIPAKHEMKKAVSQTAAAKAPAPKAAPVASTKPSKHVVKKGETFYSISRDHKVSLKSLIAANPTISPSRLREGQTLVVDGNAKAPVKKAPVAKAPAPKPAPKAVAKVKEAPQPAPSKKASSAIRTITVNQQMTYSQFASKYGASTTQLNSLNGLSLSNNTMLAKGSELYVPQY